MAAGEMEPIDSVERAARLAESFPSLRGVPGARPFCADQLDGALPGRSHGEQCAARFVLYVWNPLWEWRCGRFDLAEAITTWDAAHLAAFQAWAADPYFL